MDRYHFGANFTRLPFLFKRAAGIAMVSAAAGVAAFGAADVQQPDLDEFRQLVKQSDKLLRKGNLPEAEKLLADDQKS